MDITPTRFEELWHAGRDRGPWTGLPTHGDPFTAACWYHQGASDMACLFAQGQGAMLQKLEEIRLEVARLSDTALKIVQAQPVGEDS